jgi:hypothetical protein
MPAPAKLIELVERFKRDRESYLSSHYNETQLRREFVDPLFEALGWDVDNTGGFAEAYKDVVHEDSIRIGGGAKSPDYSFRIGGVRKFFVETKKPAIRLKADKSSAFQLRRYAWSAKLPVSILTNFEAFAVYDTRIRPKDSDKASKGRILYLTFDTYADRWDELAALFSPEGIRRGGLDKYAKAPSRRGSALVDDAFLKEMQEWRESLAKSIALRNANLSVEELNYSVQMTIDRIVFLRIAEDRGLEPYGQLKESIAAVDVYDHLAGLFRTADARYNSGLFYFEQERARASEPDTLTPEIKIDDKVLREIIGDLYYPESPYEFSVLPADILGQVYEQFLGKVIRLTTQHRAVIEDKPEIKKAGGVYYTPTYIVSFIVQQTVGELLKGKRPTPATTSNKNAASIKVLDPACGSGSFLLVAYQHLLDWHRDWYVEDDATKWSRGNSATLRRAENGQWRLTPQERKRILLDSIFGVDIDAQAVEVTKLSLLLKVLEGETQLGLFHERALPDLDQNIRRGNSIIEPDFGQRDLGDAFSVAEENRLHPFSYEAEYPTVFNRKRPGFDAVIGNPPYVLLQWLNEAEVEGYLEERYESARYKINTYQVFTERGVKLLRDEGKFGYITPSSYFRNKHAYGLRDFLLRSSQIELVRVFYYPVFKKVSEDTCITILTKEEPVPDHRVSVIMSKRPEQTAISHAVSQASWQADPDKQFGVAGDDAADEIAAHINRHSIRLGEIATAYFGIQTHDRTKYVATKRRSSHYRPVIDGADIGPYRLKVSRDFVEFVPKAIKSGGNPAVYSQARIGVRQIGEIPVATLIPANIFTLNTIYNIFFVRPTEYDLRFVLAVICSAPLRWYWRKTNFDQKKTFPKIKKAALLGIPLPKIDFASGSDSAKHAQILELVDEILESTSGLSAARLGADKTTLNRRVRGLASQIDQILADLWSLSSEQLEAMALGDELSEEAVSA